MIILRVNNKCGLNFGLIVSKKPMYGLSRAHIKHPPTNFGGCQIRAGQPSRDIFEPNRKLLAAPPNFEKSIALAFLKAT